MAFRRACLHLGVSVPSPQNKRTGVSDPCNRDIAISSPTASSFSPSSLHAATMRCTPITTERTSPK